MSLPPIVLSGKSAASYVWNSYEGNCIAKMAKSAYAFFMGTRVRLSEARKYIARDATKNTYARSILERSVEVIDGSEKKLLSMAQAQMAARETRKTTPANPNVLASETPNPGITAPMPQPTQQPMPHMQQPMPQPTQQPMPYMQQPMPQPTQQPMPYMQQPMPQPTQQPMPHMQQPMPQPTQQPMPYMQQPMPQPAVAATNGPVSDEIMNPEVANSIYNALGTLHQLLAIFPVDGDDKEAERAQLFDKGIDFVQQIHNGQMPKEKGFGVLLGLIDAHVKWLPVTDNVRVGLVHFAKELLTAGDAGEDAEIDNAIQDIMAKYELTLKQGVEDLIDHFVRGWKLNEPEKCAMIKIVEECIALLEPANRGGADLGQKMAQNAARLVDVLPADIQSRVYPSLPTSVHQAFLNLRGEQN